MIGVVLGIIGGLVLLALLVGLYVWTRRSERDIEIPARELSADEQQTDMVQRAAANNIIGGGGAFH